MERIIINEVDNTSNVESLSSYDIVYVPGFANGPNGSIDESLYRVPTLVRDKYEFVRLYGSTVPKFKQSQPYPANFPASATGDQQNVYSELTTNRFSDIADIIDSTYYAEIDSLPTSLYSESNHYSATRNESLGVWTLSYMTPAAFAEINKTYSKITATQATGEETEGTIYYLREGTSGSYTFTQQTEDPSSWADIFTIADDLESNILEADDVTLFYTKVTEDDITVYTQVPNTFTYTNLFASDVNPSDNTWYQYAENEYHVTEDTYIHPENSYYVLESGKVYMFQGEIWDDQVLEYAGDADPGYRYAYALLSMGVPVYYEQMNLNSEGITVSNMYDGLENRFIGSPTNPDPTFDSVGDFSVKFITSGGYPTFEYATTGAGSLTAAMIEMAATREDSIAIIDHTNYPDRPLQGDGSVIEAVRAAGMGGAENAKYATMFTPWYECSAPGITADPSGDTSFNNNIMPGSLAYLTSLAVQVKNYNPWLAVAGVSRGLVPYCSGLHTNKPLTNNIADSYQALPGLEQGVAISINPITYIRNYGYCIWGNRTLRNNSAGTKASSFLNIRSAVSDIKKRLYEASQQLLFEQNTDVLWLNFQSLVTPLLETMISDYILADYSITRLFVDPQTGYNVPAYEVMAAIRIQPINSVEVFDLTVYLENTDEFNITTSEVEIG